MGQSPEHTRVIDKRKQNKHYQEQGDPQFWGAGQWHKTIWHKSGKLERRNKSLSVLTSLAEKLSSLVSLTSTRENLSKAATISNNCMASAPW